jgi:hypothetical protein
MYPDAVAPENDRAYALVGSGSGRINTRDNRSKQAVYPLWGLTSNPPVCFAQIRLSLVHWLVSWPSGGAEFAVEGSGLPDNGALQQL